MAKRLILACAVASCCTTLAPGCTTTVHQPTSFSTTNSPSNLYPQDDARRIMADFGIELPADATHIQVIKPPLEDFRAKAVISFFAPRDAVMNQTCKSLQLKDFEHPPLMGGFDDEIVSEAGVSIDRLNYGFCEQYQRGRKILVLIPLADNQTTYVVLYHMPYR